MSKDFKYDAFISYRHTELDKRVAAELQKLLESYKPPKAVAPGNFKRWHVFRDETELPTSSNLSEDIKSALESSEFLIVICSESTKKSRWCMEEINYFKKLHNGSNENIITVLASGEPGEVFPDELCNEMIPVKDSSGNVSYQSRVIEPLAANIAAPTKRRTLKNLKTEFLRIAAPLLGCGYDSLYNRDQKRRYRRVLAIGAMVVSFVFAFGMYSSAMLLQISRQQRQLQAANTDLQKKTEELDQSNKNLQKANGDLEVKTAEAQNNLAEAQLQRQNAEENLKEAQTQRKNAEENLAEANRQKAIAENNMAEANRQRAIAEDNLKEANRQKAIAEENLAEANRQKSIAEENLNEANRQKTIAEENMNEANRQRTIAEENSNEANRQKNIAEKNAIEADIQRGIAESNMLIAQENEEKANQANYDLRVKNSEILANQAKIYLEADDRKAAIRTAIEALPQGENDDLPVNTAAEYVLAEATRAYSSDDYMYRSTVNLSGYVRFLEFSGDGTRLLAMDSTYTVYLIDYENESVIATYSPHTIFNKLGGVISDLAVDGMNAYILSDGQLVAINMNDGSVMWINNELESSWFKNLTFNSDSDFIFTWGVLKCAVYSKNGALISDSNKLNPSNLEIEKGYVDADGNIYLFLYDMEKASSELIVTDAFGNEKENNIDVDGTVLSIGETDDSIFFNFSKNDRYESDAESGFMGRILSIDKKTLDVNWCTEYLSSEYLWDMVYNTVFDFKHRVETDSGEWITKDSVMVISGKWVMLADRISGEIYWHSILDDSPIYAEKRDDMYALKLGYPESFYMAGYVYQNRISSANTHYTFDKARDFIAHSPDDKFALASRNSSEVAIYRKEAVQNYEELSAFSGVDFASASLIADKNGIMALYIPLNDDTNIKHNYVSLYDIENDKLIKTIDAGFVVKYLNFTDNGKLIVIGYGNEFMLYDVSGQISSTLNLTDEFKRATGKNGYISAYSQYITVFGNKIIYCTSDGIMSIDASGSKPQCKNILFNINLSDYDMSADLHMCAFVKSFYTDKISGDKIAYFKDGDSEISFVKDNGTEFMFTNGAVSSVTVADIGDRLAFIDKTGYIGVYDYGAQNVRKIYYAPGESTPLSVSFTPDGNGIIAVCYNGEIIRYSVHTLEKLGSYTTDFEMREWYSDIQFIDGNTFIIVYAGNAFFINADTMQARAEVSNFIHYIKDSWEILVSYTENSTGQGFGLYDYYSTQELIDYSKKFLETLK